MSKTFIAVIKRLPGGKGVKISKNTAGTRSLSSFKDGTLLAIQPGCGDRNLQSYFKAFPKNFTKFINYGTTRNHTTSASLPAVQTIEYSKCLSNTSSKETKVDVSPEEALYGNSMEVPENGSKKKIKAKRKKQLTLNDIQLLHESGKKIVMLTGYDYPSAQLACAAGVDIILVGDSLGMVMLGYPDTVPVTMDEMLHHSKAVVRGAKRPVIVGDLPFGSYLTIDDALKNGCRLMKEAGVGAVKLEGGRRVIPQVKALVDAGIPVMGHIGLTPQSHSQLGGFRVQGRHVTEALNLYEDALALQEAGAFGVVLELVPSPVAHCITQNLRIPTIGIGAGPETSGQVLVYHDILGMFDKFQPKFCKQYSEVGKLVQSAIEDYCEEVKSKQFPTEKHCWDMDDDNLSQFLAQMPKKNYDSVRNRFSLTPPIFESPEVLEFKNRLESDKGLKIVVIGGGAMGSLFAGKLSKLGEKKHKVWLMSKWKEHVRLINEKGLSIHSSFLSSPGPVQSYPLNASSDVNEVTNGGTEKADIAIILVKSAATEEAARLACEVIDPHGVAVTLQNGGSANYDVISKIVGKEKTLSGVTTQASKILSGGKVEHTGEGVTSLLSVSKDTTLASYVATHLCSLFNSVGLNTRFVQDPQESQSVLWNKLVINSAINPLTAVFGLNNGALLAPAFRPVITDIVNEVVQVGKCNGLHLDPQQAVEDVLKVCKATQGNVSSMLADIRRGNPTEIMAINGFVEQKAKALGLKTPINSFVTNLVKAAESVSVKPTSKPQLSVVSTDFPVPVLKTKEEMKKLAANYAGKVGFVATMGALHSGHLALVSEAKKECDTVIVSIFVNPTQFGPNEDFGKYPRSLNNDLKLLKEIGGVDAVFAPDVQEMFPANDSTFVNVDSVSRATLESESRPGHFRGVATVCTKLFNIVRPDKVYFGQKDGMQSILIKKLVSDLAFPIDVRIIDTLRESDGLALSSRNAYLSPQERKAAPVVYQALKKAKEIFQEKQKDRGEGLGVAALKKAVEKELEREELVSKIEYVSVANNNTAEELSEDLTLHPPSSFPLMLSTAVRLGNVRLIDNILL